MSHSPDSQSDGMQTGAQAQSARQQDWVVMVVDDEPDVHAVTELILSDVRFCGAPIVLKSVFSAQQAKAYFTAAQSDVALVLLDVVMEEDDTGLSLVRYIREELCNEDVQIILRTGQPGYAPEKEVVENYNINGYFLKTEATAQKLYMIVISALRTYQHIKNIRNIEHPFQKKRLSWLPQERRTKFFQMLSDAIANGAFDFHVQPQISLSDNAIIALGLKPTWRLSSKLILEPAQLSHIVGGTDLVFRLNQYLLGETIAWLKRWRTQFSDAVKITVPIIVASADNNDLFTILERCHAATDLLYGQLGIEIPETTILDESHAAVELTERLALLGIAVTIADFGTGHTSLLQLQRLRINCLKIHRWLVRKIASSSERSTVARSIIALAHTMGMSVSADGITTQDELQFFKWEGCDLGQGDFICKPIPIEDAAALFSLEKMHIH